MFQFSNHLAIIQQFIALTLNFNCNLIYIIISFLHVSHKIWFSFSNNRMFFHNRSACVLKLPNTIILVINIHLYIKITIISSSLFLILCFRIYIFYLKKRYQRKNQFYKSLQLYFMLQNKYREMILWNFWLL